ncbi:MAG: cell division ATP-binding protein FtsE [Pseudomonadota bacterium]
MILLDHVTKIYDTQYEALKNVSLEIEQGEFVIISGHSGAGKSTLLRLIARVERPTRGQLVVKGQNLERLSAKQVAAYRRQVGFVFQDHRLLNDRNIFDNVALPLEIAGMRRTEMQKRVRAALDKVGLLKKERLNPVGLSSGEQQRVGIARAVVNRPHILLADEPTGNLDPSLSQEIVSLFQQFNQVGVTVLLATHDALVLAQGGARRVALARGNVEAIG